MKYFCLAFFLMGCDPHHEPMPGDSKPQGKVVGQFNSISSNILIPKCVSCHSGAEAPHGIVLDSFESIIESDVFPPLVVPGNPEKSSLFISIQSGSMPKDESRLSQSEIRSVFEWIRDGAKDESRVPDGDEPNPDDPVTLPGEPCEVRKIENEPHYIDCIPVEGVVE